MHHRKNTRYPHASCTSQTNLSYSHFYLLHRKVTAKVQFVSPAHDPLKAPAGHLIVMALLGPTAGESIAAEVDGLSDIQVEEANRFCRFRRIHDPGPSAGRRKRIKLILFAVDEEDLDVENRTFHQIDLDFCRRSPLKLKKKASISSF